MTNRSECLTCNFNVCTSRNPCESCFSLAKSGGEILFSTPRDTKVYLPRKINLLYTDNTKAALDFEGFVLLDTQWVKITKTFSWLREAHKDFEQQDWSHFIMQLETLGKYRDEYTPIELSYSAWNVGIAVEMLPTKHPYMQYLYEMTRGMFK